MSAVLKDAPQLSPMRESDLDEVMAIERAIYSHPWTRGNFVDSINAGYECRCLRLVGELVGYFVLMVAAQEAHLLNLSIAAPSQRRGYGSDLLREAADLARRLAAREYAQGRVVDPADAQPVYLRDKVALTLAEQQRR